MPKYASVDEYIEHLDGWQAEAAKRLRALVLEEVPGAGEAIKWAQPVWSHEGPFAYLKAFRSHINFGFWRGASLTDPRRMIKSGGEKMGHVRITEGDSDWDHLRTLVRQAAALNEVKADPTRGGK